MEVQKERKAKAKPRRSESTEIERLTPPPIPPTHRTLGFIEPESSIEARELQSIKEVPSDLSVERGSNEVIDNKSLSLKSRRAADKDLKLEVKPEIRYVHTVTLYNFMDLNEV